MSAEWSRSRFWLSHFLNSRHQRPRLAWQAPAERAVEPAVLAWLARAAARQYLNGLALVLHAAADGGKDPAYVQTLRLMMKERQYHAQLLRQLAQHWGSPRPAAAPLLLLHNAAKLLGVRFQLSVLLLDDLIDLALIDRLLAYTSDATARLALETVAREKRAHQALCIERLTMAFADFNFIRRNLRRARLRGMFALELILNLALHQRLVTASGEDPAAFARHGWRRFEAALERMVPYRREALRQALLAQVQEPYAEPLRTPWD